MYSRRFQAWLFLAELHRLGVFHGDFTPDNVVVDETGFPRIIDFGQGGLHSCNVAHRQFKLFENEPEMREFGCAELYESSTEMDLWTPGTHSRKFRTMPCSLMVVFSLVSILWYHYRHACRQDCAGRR